MGPRSGSWAAASLAALLLPTLLACDDGKTHTDASAEAVNSPRQLDPAGALAVFTLSPQAPDVASGHDTAVVGLIRPDGGLQVAPMRPMDAGRALWDDHGIFVSDDTHDHLWSDGRWTSVASKKANFQNGAVRLADASVLAVYNDGYGEDGSYLDDLVVTTDAEARVSDLDGDHTHVADCGRAGAWGLGTNFGDDHPKWREGQVLVQRLDPTAHDAPAVWADLGHEAVVSSRNLACDGAQLLALTSAPESDEGDYLMSVLRVDLASGKHHVTPLRLDGEPVSTGQVSTLAAEGFSEHLTLDAAGIGADGRVQWLSDAGTVYATDPLTGDTVRVHDSGLRLEATDQTETAVTGTEWWLLVLDGQGERLTLHRVDRATGRAADPVVVDSVKDVWAKVGAEPDVQVLRGFAPAPTD